MSMAHEAQFGSSFDDKEHDDENDKLGQPNKVVRQFYFVKFNSNIVDPALRATIESAETTMHQLDSHEEHIVSVVNSIRETLVQADIELDRTYYACLRAYKRPEEVVRPTTEVTDIKQKIQTLTSQLAHGTNNLADEKRILQELKYLQGRKEELDTDAMKVRTSKEWYCGTKYDIQSKSRDYLEYKIKQKIAPLEEQLYIIREKQHRALGRKLMAESQIRDQIACYDEYITLSNKAKELAAAKDWIALEQLSRKQVEMFMSRWRSDDAFRTNYQRSIMPSLASRNLNSAGMMLNPWEKPTIPGKRFRWQTKPLPP